MSEFKFGDIPADEVYDTAGLSGYIKLWRQVLDQAVDDAIRSHAYMNMHKEGSPLHRKYQSELEQELQYLRAVPSPEESYDDETPGILQVCALARIPYDMVRRKVKILLEEKGIKL